MNNFISNRKLPRTMFLFWGRRNHAERVWIDAHKEELLKKYSNTNNKPPSQTAKEPHDR